MEVSRSLPLWRLWLSLNTDFSSRWLSVSLSSSLCDCSDRRLSDRGSGVLAGATTGSRCAVEEGRKEGRKTEEGKEGRKKERRKKERGGERKKEWKKEEKCRGLVSPEDHNYESQR